MKYLITENQFDNIVFKYLDNQDFIRIKKRIYIHFVNSEGDRYSQIRYSKKDGWCFISFSLIQEISSFFSLGRFDCEQVIGRWVENTLGMNVVNASMVNDLQMNIYSI